jgi:adenosine deaminase
MDALARTLEALPKVDLHCHLEGTMRPATVVELARKNAVPLPTSDPQELYSYSSLDEFLTIFWLVQSTLADPDDWARLAYEAVTDSARHGVVHQECFFTPARHLADGQSLASIIAGIGDGLAAAEAETGTSGSRSRSARPPTWSSPTASTASRTTCSPRCARPGCSPRSTPTTPR